MKPGSMVRINSENPGNSLNGKIGIVVEEYWVGDNKYLIDDITKIFPDNWLVEAGEYDK